jgi:hypothetical protein
MPDAGESVRSDKANIFTDAQKIQKATTPVLTIYRIANSVGNSVDLNFDLNDSGSVETNYGTIECEIVDPTDGSEDAKINFKAAKAGVNTVALRIIGTGELDIGNNSRLRLAETGLTAQRTVTFNDANTVVVGETNTQALTNKTLDARLNTVPNIAVNPIDKRWGCAQPSTVATATGCMAFDGMLAGHVGTAGGSASVTFDTTEGVISNYISAASSGVQVGIVAPNAVGMSCRRLFAVKMSARVKIDSTTTARMYVGFASAAVAISDTPIASGVDGVLVGFTSAATNFEIYSNDNVSTMTTTAITGPIAKNANWHTIEINWAASGNVDVVFDGTTQTLSSNIPLTTTNLFFNAVAQTSAATARTLSVHSVWIQSDK